MDKPRRPSSPHVNFYRSFGRPIGKVFLGAVVTYQTIYWIWVKLETDEIKDNKRKEISDLEAKVRRMQDKP
ncbi:hypothetical protein HO173_013215 [Letharia columbiana]|uniref:Uncharacterized protein n=1 Tax=Letharia columbiana TaxID=112416 RepID=A0A8H6FDF4_9LECA|nr:uncharacterized protein HO173_013215 [Letharia columbiana]KAF6223789.1 hypothetical protein HO173_013215 [Letharia columbiana]